MKKYIALLICSLSIFIFAGCADKMDEPDITVDYLEGEYAEQLLTDGAEEIVGSVDIFYNDDEALVAKISEKQVVPDSDRKKGYYIADANYAYERLLGPDCRIVYIANGEPVVGNAEDYASKYNNKPDNLYKVYCFSESCELIIAIDPSEEIE